VHITRAVHIFGDLALTRQLNVPAGGALPLQAADALLSDQEVEAEIAFSDGSKMTVGPGAQLVVQALQARTVSRPLVIAMHLERGEVRSQVERLYRVEDRFEVSTPNLVAHVKGTVFRVDVRADGTRVATDEGVVRVNWRGQVIDVEAGQELSVLLKASVPEVHVRPQSPALVSDIPADSVVVGQNGEQTFFTYANTVSWQVRTLPGAEVEFYVNDQLAQTVRADVQGRTVVDFSPAEEGTYRITAVMATLTGEKSLPSPAQVLVIDRTPPSLLLTSPTEPQVSADSVMVAGRTEPDVRLTLNGHPVAVDEKGDFKQTLALSPGANPFTLIAIDRAGNSIKLQSVIIYELPAG
jgi:hypothetical protein